MRILLVKTSSLGDVVHNLPVVTDILKHHPTAQIDWVVEEGFVDIPRLHPGIHKVIAVSLRRWRKQLGSRITWHEIKAFRDEIKSETYDFVIDSQGLLKSALITWLAHGPKHGFSKETVRESLAASFYDSHHAISPNIHAVQRNRLLAASVLGYHLNESPDYGIQNSHPAATWQAPQQPYAVILSATSRDDKRWADDHWIALGQSLRNQGIQSIFPGGSATEHARSQALAAATGGVSPPQLGIAALSSLMQGAIGVIGVDTGLTHLAAALGKPTIAIFCASQPGLTGVLAPQPVANLGNADHPPSVEAVLKQFGEW